MISRDIPADNTPSFEVAGCFIEYKGKILLLHRIIKDGNCWGLPAGRIEKGETPLAAVKREIKEETGIIIKKDPDYIGKYIVSDKGKSFIYHEFRLELSSLPNVTLDRLEHDDFIWSSPREALKMDLIKNLDSCIMDFYKQKLNTE